MKHVIETDAYVAGDIHGQPRFLQECIFREDVHDCAFIVLGDIGLGFDNNHKGCCKFLEKLGTETNITFYLFRGNHDNPESYKGKNKEETEAAFPHVVIMEDFDEIVLKDGREGIVVAGGISIDRVYRVEGRSYWRDELVNYAFIPERTYDFVVAHSGPTPPFLDPKNPLFTRMLTLDPDLVKVIKLEQDYFDMFIDKAKPKHWYNGHYHWRGAGVFEYRGTTVEVFGEATNETLENNRMIFKKIA